MTESIDFVARFFQLGKIREEPSPNAEKFPENCWTWTKQGQIRVLKTGEVHAKLTYWLDGKPLDVRKVLYQQVFGEVVGTPDCLVGTTDCLVPDCGVLQCCQPKHMHIYHPRKGPLPRVWKGEYLDQLNYALPADSEKAYIRRELDKDLLQESAHPETSPHSQKKARKPAILRRRSGRLSRIQKEAIVDLYMKGESIAALARHYEKTRQTIYNAIPDHLRGRRTKP